MKNVIGYIRVSTDRQADSGLSLEAQESKIRAYAHAMDLHLAEIICDAGHSAKTLKRPGIQRILDMVGRRDCERLVVAKLDRLTRSVKDLASIIELFEKKDASLMSVADSLDTKSATGRLVVNLMISVAQWEREVISERTKDGLAAKRIRGEKLGGKVPYGYMMDGARLVEREYEQCVINEIIRRRNEGLSFRDIAYSLNARGLRTREGGLWQHQYVSRILSKSLRKTAT